LSNVPRARTGGPVTATPSPQAADAETFYHALDNVELTSVGIDIGSTTSHLMFSRVHLKRETQRHSTRYVVVAQQVLWRSRIRLTPYLDDGLIDAAALGGWVDQDFAAAGLTPSDLDSGAVILTGEALKQHNAKALADVLAAQAGEFVCVSAGHHLEALLAAYGSGSAALSVASGQRILCIDIGGGTTKLSLIDQGTVRHTAAIEVGARMVSFDGSGAVRQATPAALAVLDAGSPPWGTAQPLPGARLDAEGRQALAAAAASQILAVARRRSATVRRSLLLTGPLPPAFERFDAITFAGGVAEYIYGREDRDFGDVGADIAAAVRTLIDTGGLPAPVLDPGTGIRATVVGASQSSVQVSGSTVSVPAETVLPLRNVPVLHPVVDLSGDIEQSALAAPIREALDSAQAPSSPVALAFHFGGPPSYSRLRALAGGIAAALDGAGPAASLVMVVDRDIAASLGGIFTDEVAAIRPVLCLDNLDLRPFDYLDIGRPIWPAGVYPVVIKSLLFGPASGPDGKAASP
jgi:ethanolamine utilization protein EutA